MEINGYKGVVGDQPRAISFWYRSSVDAGFDAQRGDGTLCYWGQDPSGGSTNGREWRIGTRSSPSRIQVNGRGSYLTHSGIVEDNEWHHVLVNFEGGDNGIIASDIYVDGSLGISGTAFPNQPAEQILTTSGTNVVIGARPTSAGGFAEYFQGDLDSFAIWNSKLSGVSIAHVSSSAAADVTTIAENSNLQVWLKLGEGGDTAGAGGTMLDSSSQGRNASTTVGTTISG
jgi:hypothetical protein